MPEVFTGSVNNQFNWNYSSEDAISTTADSGQAPFNNAFSGSKMYRQRITLAASGVTTLTPGSGLTDVLGNSISFTKLYGLILQNLGSGGGFDLTLGTILQAADNFNMLNTGTYDGPEVQPGGELRLFSAPPNVNGYSLTGGSDIKVTNLSGAHPATYNIFLFGD